MSHVSVGSFLDNGKWQEKRETEKLFNDSNALILLVVSTGILTMVLIFFYAKNLHFFVITNCNITCIVITLQLTATERTRVQIQ